MKTVKKQLRLLGYQCIECDSVFEAINFIEGKLVELLSEPSPETA